jgi:hypothetical protein
VALAINTGIAPDVWWRQDPRDLATALDIVSEERERQVEQERSARVVDSA